MSGDRLPSSDGDARATAVRILRERFEGSVPFAVGYSSEGFSRLSLPDQLLVRELVGGVVRHLSLIDHLLAQVSNRPLLQVDPVVLWILRVAVYQIRWLRVPDYASVDEAVRLTGILGRIHARSFVNAVLRSLLRSDPSVPEGRSVSALAVRHSHPTWLVRRWCDRYGPARTDEILERNNSRPPSVLRVNTFRISPERFLGRLADEGIAAEPLFGDPACVRVDSRGFVRHPLYRDSYCYFMDYSSQRVAHFGDPGKFRRVADLCAAPGGKSIILASRLRPGTPLLCIDVDGRRLDEMRTRVRRLQVPGLQLIQADATASLPLAGSFGFILADVPCSGLGTLRSNPDIKWFIREPDLVRWQERQRRILSNAFRLLEPGGELIYSTCSTEPEENEQVAESFLSFEPGASLEEDFWRSFPPDGPGDGFFAAHLRRS